VARPSYEQPLHDLQSMTCVAIGREYGVSDNAVRKWIRWYAHQQARSDYEDARREGNDHPGANEPAD
jgi:transposase-like protein